MKKGIIMSKEVELFIGVPCSGKSTYLRNNYNPEDVFVLSRDDVRNELIKGTDYVYSDFFKIPKAGDKPSEKYGEVLPTGEWSKVSHLNEIVKNNFDKRIQKANDILEKDKKVIVDLVNMTRQERDMVKGWFKNVENVTFSAVIFDYKNNLDTIKTQITPKKHDHHEFPYFNRIGWNWLYWFANFATA